jgi:IS5 family transposase
LQIKKHYKKRQAADGRPAYPPLPLFKMLLLARWYNLSDPGLEEAVSDRLSFLRFTGFSFESSIPDETTICRFRNELIRKGLYRKLLDRINNQLEKKGALVKQGAIVDAALVTSSRRPRKVIDVMPEDRREDEGPEDSGHKVSYSDDAEAAWVRKGKQPHYGYKVHMATDAIEGFILGGHVPGNKLPGICNFRNSTIKLNCSLTSQQTSGIRSLTCPKACPIGSEGLHY